jgi:hypothetical protein
MLGRHDTTVGLDRPVKFEQKKSYSASQGMERHNLAHAQR